jgi:L-threonylcarbamoyladenylate synthase
MSGPFPAGFPGRVSRLEDANAQDLFRISGAIRAGGVIALLTETLWGLSADPFSGPAMERVASLKGRSPARGFLCLIPALDALPSLGVSLDRRMAAALERLWPAPVTVVLPSARPPAASGGLATVAVRIPSAEALLRLLRATGPLASTSANVEGAAPAATADEIERSFGGRISWIVGDKCPANALPSSLVDAVSRPARIVRAGSGAEAAEDFIRALDGYPESL